MITIQDAFEKFVDRELGDVAVKDNGRYISQKITNYWRTWQGALEWQAGIIANKPAANDSSVHMRAHCELDELPSDIDIV